MTPGTVRHAEPRRLIMEVIKRSPLISPLLFRAYNHVLRRMSAEHDARAYFGAKFRCNLDDMIPRMIFYFGFWEPNNSALIGSILKPGDVFVDVGANIGYYTLLGSSLIGAQGRVVSIEPSPAIFAQLQENTSANGAANARLRYPMPQGNYCSTEERGGTAAPLPPWCTMPGRNRKQKFSRRRSMRFSSPRSSSVWR